MARGAPARGSRAPGGRGPASTHARWPPRRPQHWHTRADTCARSHRGGCGPMQGVLLQLFTKPLGDRPTVFIEIIERLCLVEGRPNPVTANANVSCSSHRRCSCRARAGRCSSRAGPGARHAAQVAGSAAALLKFWWPSWVRCVACAGGPGARRGRWVRWLWQGQLLRALQEHRGLRNRPGHQLIDPLTERPVRSTPRGGGPPSCCVRQRGAWRRE